MSRRTEIRTSKKSDSPVRSGVDHSNPTDQMTAGGGGGGGGEVNSRCVALALTSGRRLKRLLHILSYYVAYYCESHFDLLNLVKTRLARTWSLCHCALLLTHAEDCNWFPKRSLPCSSVGTSVGTSKRTVQTTPGCFF